MSYYPRLRYKVRHQPPDLSIEVEPQRARLIPYWYSDPSLSLPEVDLSDEETVGCRIGSIVKSHKVEALAYPESTKPGRVYYKDIMLSFADVMDPWYLGVWAATPLTTQTLGSESLPRMIPTYVGDETRADASDVTRLHFLDINKGGIQLVVPRKKVNGSPGALCYNDNQIALTVDDLRKQEMMPRWTGPLRNSVMYEQRYGMASGYKRIPKKCKRINPWTFYGTIVLNDYPRGSTPSDTKITVELQRSFHEIVPEELLK